MTLADLISQSLTYEDAKALALVFGQAPYDALLDYTLQYGDSVTVAGVAYTVRETRLLDDGAFVEIALSRN